MQSARSARYRVRPVLLLEPSSLISALGIVAVALVGIAFVPTVVSTAILLWLAMGFIASLGTTMLARRLSESLDPARLDRSAFEEVRTGKGAALRVTSAFLLSLLGIRPYLAIPLSASLCFGILVSGLNVVLASSASLSRRPLESVALPVVTILGGGLVAFLVARVLLCVLMDAHLQTRIRAYQTGTASDARLLRPAWAQMSNRALRATGLTSVVTIIALLFKLGSLAVAASARPSLHLPDALLHPPASSPNTESLPPVQTSSSPITISTYEGRTGSKAARFQLTWDRSTRSVTGSYYTLDRPDRVYALRGTNPADSQLRLEEFTNDSLSATVRLSKSVRGGRIRWSGTMHNTDGRRFPVVLERSATQ